MERKEVGTGRSNEGRNEKKRIEGREKKKRKR